MFKIIPTVGPIKKVLDLSAAKMAFSSFCNQVYPKSAGDLSKCKHRKEVKPLMFLAVHPFLLLLLLLSSGSTSADSKDRVLRGVMRVGLVAKGLLLKGDAELELVLLCSNKPTVTLLKQVAEKLLEQLEVGSGAQFSKHNSTLEGSVITSLFFRSFLKEHTK